MIKGTKWIFFQTLLTSTFIVIAPVQYHKYKTLVCVLVEVTQHIFDLVGDKVKKRTDKKALFCCFTQREGEIWVGEIILSFKKICYFQLIITFLSCICF